MGAQRHQQGCASKDECSRKGIHEKLVPSALRVPWTEDENPIQLYFYYLRFVANPDDRMYRLFGLFLKVRLPKEAEEMEVDLHLSHGRFVKAGIVPSGSITFDRHENFQEMCLKVILHRSEFFADFVDLGKHDGASQHGLSTFYLLLPLKKQSNEDNMAIDWMTVSLCMSSPVFGQKTDSSTSSHGTFDTLKLINGLTSKSHVLNSLVFTPHNRNFYFVDGIYPQTNGISKFKDSADTTHVKSCKRRYNFQLLYPEQPFLKAKQLFKLHNLLLNQMPVNTAVAKEEHFIPLPPELCSLKIIGFSKDIGSSLSLLPSLMHRLECLLVAIELKDNLSIHFAEASQIRANRILEALTTAKCLESFSLERLEVLGDAFLKYAVGRHNFLSYRNLDEGDLSMRRSSLTNNQYLYELAIRKNLQVYIHDELFDPSQFFGLGYSCVALCNENSLEAIQSPHGTNDVSANSGKCTRSFRWLQNKTVADVVEALIGVFLVESGFKAAGTFLRWIGIPFDYSISDLYKVCEESKSTMSLIEYVDVDALEKSLGYTFQHRSLLLQAFVHPSVGNLSGVCYQRLEFLGDAALDYLITSYLYSVYPDIKPGQLTDLRSAVVGNYSFGHIAVSNSFHSYLINNSNGLKEAVSKFENFVRLPDSERDPSEEPECPKVLGDIVESCIGSVLLDTGFNLKELWRVMLKLLDSLLSFTNLQLIPIRELRELCQSNGFELVLPDIIKDKGGYLVKVEIDMKGEPLSFSAINQNSKSGRRMAAKKALSKLKALGYKHKKFESLEKILRSATKQKPELIGFDEEPILMDFDSEQYVKSSQYPEKIPSGSHLHNVEESSFSITIEDCIGYNCQEGVLVGNPMGTIEEASFSSQREANRILVETSARSRLFEICATNHWDPPSFELCEEGPVHQRIFTCKVTIVMGSITILECLSERKPEKNAAEEHAAEGAIWYLKHSGHSSRPDCKDFVGLSLS
ncbi:endoribonuclease Dicer homolog 4-like isoform X2 [Typha latifolia]|uniref:endoribonuclease Dicer homolog 4-like isoform X2 n=1 Tax=Typha latifolia TaxID=4733 RepID=UPI003C2B0282